MTPTEVRALSVPEYLAFLKLMDDERREIEREARKRAGRGKARS